MENFKPIEGWPGYEVGDQGTVVSTKNGKRVKRSFSTTQDGYKTVQLKKPGKKPQGLFVHRLVAAAFIGPCPAGYEVDHINNVRDDNRAVNLRYRTPKENSNSPHRRAALAKAHRALWSDPAYKAKQSKPRFKRPVVALDGEGRPFCIFESAAQAAHMLGLSNGAAVRNVCNGLRNHTGGFKFAWWNGES